MNIIQKHFDKHFGEPLYLYEKSFGVMLDELDDPYHMNINMDIYMNL